MKKYKIGQLAKHLGVTPDFIKYYEANGIINSEPGPNSRLYAFNQSSLIYECQKLKNYGFTAKDMCKYINCETTNEFLEELMTSQKHMKERVALLNAYIEEIDRYSQWVEDNKSLKEPFSYEYIEPFYFLSHTDFQTFLDNDKIYDILESWINLMPITKSCVNIKIENGMIVRRNWGFSLRESAVKKFSVPVNEACRYIEKQKMLIYSNFEHESINEKDEKLFSGIIDESRFKGLMLTGEIYSNVFTRSKRNGKTFINAEVMFKTER